MSNKIAKPDVDGFNIKQKRSTAVALILAIGFGAYFLRNFFILISVAAIVSYLFLPLYKHLCKKVSNGLAAFLTLLTAVLLVMLPVITLFGLAFVQIASSIDRVGDWMSQVDMSVVGQSIIELVNHFIDDIPYIDYTITESDISSRIGTMAQAVGNWLLGSMSGVIGSLFGAITTSIIFIYIFISLLINHAKLSLLIERINPLGPEVSRMYMQKAGAMIHGAVGGQFVIAAIQGFTGALSVYIAGFQESFFVMALLFTVMSMIPLGSGIITIPLGIFMILFGNMAGGVFVVAWHILGVTNIDNILRPILIPRTARIDPALMLVTVFAGLSMFGFWGLFIGPVIMILIVTTVNVYLAVYENVPLPSEAIAKPKRRFKRRLARKAD